MRDERRLDGVDKDEPRTKPLCKRRCKLSGGVRAG
jgi:hypothetical protein